MKPLVSGIPAKLNKNNENTKATNGDFFPSPTQRFTSLTSPAESRTRVIIAKAPIVATPFPGFGIC